MNELKSKLITAAITIALTLAGAGIAMEKSIAANTVKVLGIDTRLTQLEYGAVRRENLNQLEHNYDTRLRDIYTDVREIRRMIIEDRHK